MAEFSAKTYEEAVALAVRELGAGEDQLDITVVKQGATRLFRRIPWVIQAQVKPPQDSPAPAAQETLAAGLADIQPAPAAQAPVQARQPYSEPFGLSLAPEGVLLTAKPGADPTEIADYCKRRGINLEAGHMMLLLRKGEFPAVIAPPMQELPPPAPDCIRVSVAKDEMSAVMVIYPGDPEGRRLSAEEVIEELRTVHKLVHGLDEAAISAAVSERRLRTEIPIAAGTPAQNGEDGALTYHFQTTHSKMPRVTDGEKIDYRTLDLFENVTAGQVLVTRTLATAGQDGMNLRGKLLKARKGRDVVMPRGVGVSVNEEKTILTASVDGMVNLIDGQVRVSTRYVVRGNVDMSVGNIDFVGDVEVAGNVISGMSITAQGSIEVHGTVEGAKLTAGGSVLLRQGMQGTGRGEVVAGGDVVSKYFERTRVTAGGTISADAAYHSELSAVQGITLSGRHGSLIGGVARSTVSVAAKTIGSSSHTDTTIEVGILPQQRERQNHLAYEVRRMQTEREKVSMMVRSFSQENQRGALSPAREQLRRRVMATYEQLSESLTQAQNEAAEIAANIESITGGKVHVIGTVHPGTRVVIGSAYYNVEKPIDYATFRFVNGEVTFSSCEY